MEKLVGRKGKTSEEKGEEHHLEAILWAGMISLLGKMISADCARNPSFLAFFRSKSEILEATQLTACFLFEVFAIGVQ
jgi:hypothetical protein